MGMYSSPNKNKKSRLLKRKSNSLNARLGLKKHRHQLQPDYEQVWANFQEAKQRFYKEARKALDRNRVNRGFYPSSKGKGKGKGGNTSEKVYGKDSNIRCIRCGKLGHKAMDCRQIVKQVSSTASTNKTTGFVGFGMSFEPKDDKSAADTGCENGEIYSAQDAHAIDRAIIDCGASESIVGAHTLQRLCDRYLMLGLDPEAELKIDRDVKWTFIFGNNQTAESLGLAQLTACIGGAEIVLKLHIVEGQTPICCCRLSGWRMKRQWSTSVPERPISRVHRRFYTQTLLHTVICTQTLLHTDPFTHRRFYTQLLLHRNTFTHRRFYTQIFLHTNSFAHAHTSQYNFVLQRLHKVLPVLLPTTKLTPNTSQYYFVLHSWHKVLPSTTSYYTAGTKYFLVLLRTTQLAQITSQYYSPGPSKLQFYFSFWRSNLISCEKVAPDASKLQFYLSFCRSNLISCEKVAPDASKLQFYFSFCRSNPHFVRKGGAGPVELTILPQFLTIEPHFVRKGCRRSFKIAIIQFLTIEPHFVRKGRISWRLVGTAPRLRNRKEKEKARGQESKTKARRQEREDVKMRRCEKKDVRRCEKMWRREDGEEMTWEDVKMWRWEDEMWRCEDVVKMWGWWWEDDMRRCKDVRMWRWEDEMWRCEDVKMWWEDVMTDLHY